MDGVRYDETVRGYRAYMQRYNASYAMPIYAIPVISQHWPVKGDVAQFADPMKYVVLPCTELDTAARLAALYCRFIHNSFECTHWLGDQIAFEIPVTGAAKAWGIEEAVTRIKALPSRLLEKQELPLVAEDVDLKRLPGVRIVPLQIGATATRPILYLNLEGVLVIHPPADRTREEWRRRYPRGEPTPGAKQFLYWVERHFDVRWAAPQAPMGELYEWQAKQYCEVLDVPLVMLRTTFSNPKGCWQTELTAGIDFTQANWAFITNRLMVKDEETITKHNAADRVYLCDADSDPGALIRTWHYLRRDFKIAA
jgi:hypothetical protein